MVCLEALHYKIITVSHKETLLFSFQDPGGQDTFDFPPRSDSVELTARAVSGVYYSVYLLLLCSFSCQLALLAKKKLRGKS